MKNQTNIIALPATFEDLLFSNKNKAYGAYVLRKSYKRHITIACFIAITIFTLSVSSPLLFHKDTVEIAQPNICRLPIDISLITPPSIVENKNNPAEDVKISIKTVIFTPPVVIPNDGDIINYVPSAQELTNATPWTSTHAGVPGGVDVTLLEQVVVPQNNTVKHEEQTAPFYSVEEMPSYPGGDIALLSFFSSEIQYPEIAKKAGIEGRVLLSIIVEKDGSISNARIAKGIGGGCEEEALRVMLLSGKWHAGKQNGTTVRVSMIVPVNFILK